VFPSNQTTVTVGDVLAAIDSGFLGLEEIVEGNESYPSAGVSDGGRHEEMCLCLNTETPIDFFRRAYGVAGLVRGQEHPYIWEWRVNGGLKDNSNLAAAGSTQRDK